MHELGRRMLAVLLGLVVSAAGPAMSQETQQAQDTMAQDTAAMDQAAADTAAQDTAASDTSVTATAGDTTDTSAVRNPPGYRGMERDTTIFPPTEGEDPSAGAVKDRATGTYDDTAWSDTTGAVQNPAGYRGMERPVGDTGAADTTGAAAADTTGAADTTRVGETEPKEEDSATPRLEPTDSAGHGETPEESN